MNPIRKMLCDFCDELISGDDLTQHMGEKHSEYSLMCGRCDQEFFPLQGHDCVAIRESEAQKWLREALESIHK